ncbi:MAG TPA: hypothetical protein VED59_07255, partial [Acidimicrobiales bacterium]|nr:hypothetical protein [Acidimicrobiales bacterium]
MGTVPGIPVPGVVAEPGVPKLGVAPASPGCAVRVVEVAAGGGVVVVADDVTDTGGGLVEEVDACAVVGEAVVAAASALPTKGAELVDRSVLVVAS